MGKTSDTVFVGIGGHVVAINALSGEELWRQKLKGSSFVTVFPEANAVYAGAGGQLFCLDRSTGAIRWRNPLKGLGVRLITFGSSSAVAVAAAQAAQAAAVGAAAVGAAVVAST